MAKDESNKGGFDAKGVKEAMDALLSVLPDEPTEAANTLSKQKRTLLRKAVGRLVDVLREFHLALDPIHHPLNVLDPSDPHVIGQLIADTLLVQPRRPLAEVAAERFYGSGVYAIYYRGGFDAYSPTSGTDTPLYVGKVDPKAPGAETVEQQGLKLYGRLAGDHAKSIRSIENLELDDFDCRYLVVKSAWQNTAETYLIDRFKPIWNSEVGICYGIGKHGDSANTRSNTRSPWDTLHRGRPWAWKEGNTPNPKSADQIKADIAEHYRQHPPGK
jgi:Eco29kI restriction endonuclease